MRTRLLILTLLLSLAGTPRLLGQKLSVVRLEVPANMEVETFHVETLDVFGALVFYESN